MRFPRPRFFFPNRPIFDHVKRLFKMNQVPTVLFNAANIASLLTGAAALVQEIEAIRRQTEETAPEVWAQVSGEFAVAVSAWERAVETPTAHYNDARTVHTEPEAPPVA
jgi:DNA-binding transcriptional regulator YiaG